MKRIIKRTVATALIVILMLNIFPVTGIGNIFDINVSAKSVKNCLVGDEITFGSYPQTKVTDSTTVNALDEMEKDWISYGYYSGTDSMDDDVEDGGMKPSDYMKYCDLTYKRTKYRAVKFSAYRPIWTSLTTSSENSIQDDNEYYTDKVYYFKYEPLTWRVLDPAEGYVMCIKSIDSQAYQNFIIYDEESEKYYNGESFENYANDWSTCSLREWLNNDFYNTAFTRKEKSQIGLTQNEIECKISGKKEIKNVSDKIFLLSYEDVFNPDYGFSSDENDRDDSGRQIKSTDYSECQGYCTYIDYDEYFGDVWWIMDFSHDTDSVGVINDCETEDTITSVTGIGVVPAFKFNPKSEIPENSSDKKQASDSENTSVNNNTSETTAKPVTPVIYVAIIAVSTVAVVAAIIIIKKRKAKK